MNYWKYCAYDADLQLKTGVIATNGDQLAVILCLRQQLLQSTSVQQISPSEYRRELHLQKLKDRLRPNIIRQETPEITIRAKISKLLVSFIKHISRLFFSL